MNEILAKVVDVTARVLKVDPAIVDLNSRFKADLGADSINLVEIAMALELEFDIMLEDDEVSSITTVEDAVKYIQKHV